MHPEKNNEQTDVNIFTVTFVIIHTKMIQWF